MCLAGAAHVGMLSLCCSEEDYVENNACSPNTQCHDIEVLVLLSHAEFNWRYICSIQTEFPKESDSGSYAKIPLSKGVYC